MSLRQFQGCRVRDTQGKGNDSKNSRTETEGHQQERLKGWVLKPMLKKNRKEGQSGFDTVERGQGPGSFDGQRMQGSREAGRQKHRRL